jgi:hypothetical protein
MIKYINIQIYYNNFTTLLFTCNNYNVVRGEPLAINLPTNIF